jgi:hypothetical protein
MGPKGEIRPWLTFFILTFVTLGFYISYWYFKVAKEVNAFLGEEKMNPIKMYLLSVVTCGLYMIYWQWSAGPDIIKQIQAKAGLPLNPPFYAGPWQFQRALNLVWEQIP